MVRVMADFSKRLAFAIVFLGLLYPTTGVCGGTAGDLHKFWLHFLIFFAIVSILFYRKFMPFFLDWATQTDKEISDNVHQLVVAQSRKKEAEEMLMNFGKEREEILAEAHRIGLSRRDSIFQKLKEEVALREAYRDQIRKELERASHEALRKHIVLLATKETRRLLEAVPIVSQLEFFNKLMKKTNGN